MLYTQMYMCITLFVITKIARHLRIEPCGCTLHLLINVIFRNFKNCECCQEQNSLPKSSFILFNNIIIIIRYCLHKVGVYRLTWCNVHTDKSKIQNRIVKILNGLRFTMVIDHTPHTIRNIKKPLAEVIIFTLTLFSKSYFLELSKM